MHIQKVKNRITAIVLSILLVISSVCIFPSIPVNAATTTDLYGTGSADEISILKLLDMALNKGGMSMSTDTIKSFLEYWWNCVSGDMETIIADADTSITTTADFVKWLGTADIDSDWFATILKYVRFVATMETETLNDFYTLLRQPDTFRQFLLSCVTDEDGNIAGTVNSKLSASGKYLIKSDLVNMARDAADKYIEEYEGYYLVATHTVDDVLTADYNYKTHYDYVHGLVADIPDDMLIMVGRYNYGQYYQISDLSAVNFVLSGSLTDKSVFAVPYSNDWVSMPTISYFKVNYNNDFVETTDYSLVSLDDWQTGKSTTYTILFKSPYLNYQYEGWLYTSDGRSIRVYKSLDSFKAHTVGKDNIYYSTAYSSYDASVDNSYTFTGSYYNNTSTTYSHDVIQQQIDNSSEVNESTVNNIVNNYITNNYGDSSGSGDESGNGSSGSWWDIGSGISSFIEGIASLLDFILKLLGDLVSLLSTFLSSVLELLGSLSEIGSGFGTFLSSFFDFLPEECFTLILATIGVMCAVGFVKMFWK